MNASIASPSLWITTRMATCYSGSVEYLALPIINFKILYFVCSFQAQSIDLRIVNV